MALASDIPTLTGAIVLCLRLLAKIVPKLTHCKAYRLIKVIHMNYFMQFE